MSRDLPTEHLPGLVLMTVAIAAVHAREVLDSRGRPTVEVELRAPSGELARAMAPSGASTGRHEAHERRDGQADHYDGLGVREVARAVARDLAPQLLGLDPRDQAAVDARLLAADGTANKSRYGANALLAVSLANARLAAICQSQELVHRLHELWRERALPAVPAGTGLAAAPPGATPALSRPTTAAGPSLGPGSRRLGESLLLPLPMVNMISGGLHAGGQIDIQDVLAVPVGAATFAQGLEWIVRIYRRLGSLLTERGYEGVLVGDEGGYGPRLAGNEAALEVVTRAIERAGLHPGSDVALAVDAASTHYHAGGRYRLSECTASGRAHHELEPAALIDLWDQWSRRYPLISLEDGCAEDDWEGWSQLTARLGSRLQLVGDDLFVTNVGRVREGLARRVANSVLIKLNQIGTLTETLEALRLTLSAGYWPVISARSGETEDPFIADLAVATGAGQIKIGSVARSERLAKYNQLLRLEESLGTQAGYLGGQIFAALARPTGSA